MDQFGDAAIHRAEPSIAFDAALSFEEFFERERDRLFGLLVLVTGNRSEAEELAQDAFVTVWERWDHIREMQRPTAYLQRTAINAFRKRYRRARFLGGLYGSGMQPTSGAADVSVMMDELLQALTPRQRAALVLTELLGYSAEEAGGALGVKASTIGALKHQGRAALKREVELTDD